MRKDSSQAASVHDKLTDAVEKYVTANKKLKAMEEVEKKRSIKMLKLEVTCYVASHIHVVEIVRRTCMYM